MWDDYCIHCKNTFWNLFDKLLIKILNIVENCGMIFVFIVKCYALQQCTCSCCYVEQTLNVRLFLLVSFNVAKETAIICDFLAKAALDAVTVIGLLCRIIHTLKWIFFLNIKVTDITILCTMALAWKFWILIRVNFHFPYCEYYKLIELLHRSARCFWMQNACMQQQEHCMAMCDVNGCHCTHPSTNRVIGQTTRLTAKVNKEKCQIGTFHREVRYII